MEWSVEQLRNLTCIKLNSQLKKENIKQTTRKGKIEIDEYTDV